MLSYGSRNATISFVIYFSILWLHADAKFEVTKDQTTSRANTLFDDADDIQRQLDNEVRDKYGQFKTVWVFHIPTQNNLQSYTDKIPSNDLTVRIKRKINKDKTRFKSSYKIRDLKEEHCHCGEDSDNKPGEVCKCSMSECECSENSTKAESQEEDYNLLPAPPIVPAPPQQPKEREEWTFWDQHHWHKKFKACAGHAQSPVNLPVEGLIHVKGARQLVFSNYDVKACNLTVVNDGKRVVMYGTWPKKKWPMVYGGAAHSRRYLFHSLSVYWPSEHPIGGIYYPMETQLLHISSEYGSYDDAVRASDHDPLAFLGIINVYKFAKTSHPGVVAILEAARKCKAHRINLPPMSLDHFSTPFSDHVCYYGSLTTPPCTESVLWLIRRRSLPLARGVTSTLQHILRPPPNPSSEHGGEYQRLSIRVPQPLNDRKVYVFMTKE